MVTPMCRTRRSRGWATTDLIMAVAIFAIALLPLAFSIMSEVKLCRAYYYRAVAMEIVDGEMEILAAGEHRRFQPGVYPYPTRAAAAANLPGQFILTVEKERLRLEWVPQKRRQGGRVAREVRIR